MNGLKTWLAFASAILFLTASAGWATFSQDQAGAPKEINKTFEDPDLNVREFVKRFEVESREVYAKRQEIVKSLDLKPGMTVADVGAGTGLFTRLLADAVGKRGKVLAVDISPKFLAHIAKNAKDQDQPQIETILSDQETAKLPEESVDLIFICDTYHHFEKPMPMLESIRKALKAGGVLAIIDFDRTPKSVEFIQKHVRASKQTFLREIQEAGFEPIPVENPPELTENFFAKFRKRKLAKNEKKS